MMFQVLRVSVLKVRGITHDFKDTLTSIPVELAWKGKTVVKSKVAHSYQYTSRLAKCSVEILNRVRPLKKIHIKMLPINWIWKCKWSFLAALAVIRNEESPMVSVLGAAVPFLPAPGASRGGVTWDDGM